VCVVVRTAAQLCYDACVRVASALAVFLLLPVTVVAQDQLTEARRLYNTHQYEEAERAARAALGQARTANSARVVLARILLERYRQSSSEPQLVEARDALRAVNPTPLDSRERVELMLGLGQALFLEDRFAAAADVFEPILESAVTLGAAPHDRALDWWATAIDRHAATRPFPERAPIYERITRRMTTELTRDPGCGSANYWLVAAAHGAGDLDRAWSTAQASWVRASFSGAHTTTTRADIDKVMVEGIIPARAARIGARDPSLVVAGMVAEWETFKSAWTR
jgi:hypothetical protein